MEPRSSRPLAHTLLIRPMSHCLIYDKKPENLKKQNYELHYKNFAHHVTVETDSVPTKSITLVKILVLFTIWL